MSELGVDLDPVVPARFAIAAVPGPDGRVRLTLADAHVGVAPFPGVRVEWLEIEIPGPVTPAEVAAGSRALKSRRGEVKRLRFSVEEAAIEKWMRERLEGRLVSALSIRFFADHVRIYIELPSGANGQGGTCRAVLIGSLDIDEAQNVVLSFYDIRVLGRLPAGAVPSSLLDRLVPTAGSNGVEGVGARVATRAGATRVVLRPFGQLLTAWLPSAGWKVPDLSRAHDRHISLRGDRVYVEISQTATPGLVMETSTGRNLSAFEYAEAERLFEMGEQKLAAGDLEGAARVYLPHADPETGHPFALRRLAWILATLAGMPGAPTGPDGPAEKARALAAGIQKRFPDDPVAMETLAALALASGERDAAIEAFEALATRAGEENDVRGRVYAELLLGELYGAKNGSTSEEDLAAARTAYEAALSLDPDSLVALQAVAEVYDSTGESAKAIHAWWRVFERSTDPGERKALLLRIADAHLDGLKDPDAAIAVYKQAQEGDDPDEPTVEAWEGLARAYASKGDAPAAIRQLERVADRCVAQADMPGAARANFSIGELWAGPLKRPESALLRFDRALELDPHHPGALSRRFTIQKDRKAWKEALETGTRLAEVTADEKSVGLWLELAAIADKELSDPKAAAGAAASAFLVDPANTVAREAAERHFSSARDLKGLAALFEKALGRAHARTAFDLRFRRAGLFAGALADGAAAVREYASAVEIAASLGDPAAVERARTAEADLLRSQGRLGELIDVRAAQWAAAEPGLPRARLADELGRLLRERKEPGPALEWYEKSLVDDPTGTAALGALAELAQERGDAHAHAEGLLRLAAATHDGEKRVAIELQAAELFLGALKTPVRAKQTAVLALSEGDATRGASAVPTPPDVWKLLGRAQRALGERDDAASSLERWFAEVEREGSAAAAVTAAMAGEIAGLHTERGDALRELDWLEKKLGADPSDRAATRRAATLAKAGAAPARAALFVEADARLEQERAAAASLYLDAGKLWESAGDTARSEMCFRHAAAAAPQDDEPLEALTSLLLGDGRSDDAVEAWRAAAEATAGAAGAARWRRAADLARTRAADPETASRCYARLLSIDAADPGALSFLAERARAAGAWGKARDLFERLAEATPDLPARDRGALALRRAEACEKDGDPRGAEERYRLAASLDETLRDPWKAIRRLATAASRFDDAAAACEEEAKRATDGAERATLLFEAGRLALERLNDPKRAIARFQEVLVLAPGNMPALDALETTLTALSEWETLLPVLREKARRLRDPRRRADLLTRAAEIAWEKLGKMAVAAEDALAARAAAPDDSRPLGLLEKMYRAERRFDLLAPLLEERAASMPATPGNKLANDSRTALIVEAAKIRSDELGDTARAATDLERAVLEGVASESLFRLLAEVQARSGDYPRAAEALTQLAKRVDGPARAEVLYRLARIVGDELMDSATAVKHLEEARALAPAAGDVLVELETRLTALGRFRELAALFLDAAVAAADKKDSAAAFRHAGTLLRDRVDDPVAAVKAFRKALGADPDDAESLAAADALLTARGDHATRAEMFRDRLRARPDDATAREGLLSALAASGAWGELEAYLKPLADAEPVSGPSVRRLLLAYRSAGRFKDLTRFLESRVQGGELAARELLEALFAEREDWKGLADFHLRLAEGKGGRERAKAVAAAATVMRERMGDLDRARQALRDAAAARPTDGELFAAVAETFETAGDMQGLRDLLVDAAGWHDGGEKGALLRRAARITRERLSDSTRALALSRDALAIDADDEEAGEMAADILGSRHDWGALVALWTERGERGKDPRKKAFRYLTAGKIAKGKLGDPYRAAAAFRAALLFDPDDADAQKGAEEALEAAEKWDELASLRAARAARAGSGDSRLEALLSAAVIARDKLKDLPRALSLFQQASRESPGDPVPIDAAAAILAAEQRFGDLARWLLAAARGLSEEEALTRRLSAAEILLDTRGADDPSGPALALDALIKSARSAEAPVAIRALERGGELLSHLSDPATVVTFYEASLESPALADRKSQILTALGTLAREKLLDQKKAISFWRRALEIDPTAGAAFTGLESAFRATKDWEGLLAIYEGDAGFQDDPAKKGARYAAMGEIRDAILGDPKGAAADYRRAVDAEPNDLGLLARYEAALQKAALWQDLVTSILTRAARAASPPVASAFLVKAADLVAEQIGDMARAAALYEQAREGARVPDEPLVGLERAYRRLSQPEKLVVVLEARAKLATDPSARGRLFLEAGTIRREMLQDMDGAAQDFAAAREADDTSVEVLRATRDLHRARNDPKSVDDALAAEQALSEHESVEVRAALAYERGVVARDGLLNPAEAVRHFSVAVELTPTDARAVRALAEEAERIGALPLARQEFARLATLEKSPRARAETLERAAACARREGDLAAVAELLEDCIEADPDRLDGWDRLGDVYLELRRWDEARLVLGELLARSSKEGDAKRTVTNYYRLGLAERLVGQTDKAAGRLKRLLAVEPDHAGALALLSEIHRERGEWAPLAEVLAKLAKAVAAIKPGTPNVARTPLPSANTVWRELGHVLEHRLGRPADAMDAYGSALVADTSDYESMWRLSELAFQHARYDVFLATWARLAARETAPARKLALAFRAAEALRKTGRPKEAVREYEKALEVDPGHLPSWTALAALLEESREWRRAAAAFDGALRALGDAAPENSAQLLIRRGILLAEKVGDYDAAAADLARVIAVRPDDLALRFRYAGVLSRARGRTADSIAELSEILRRDPFRPEVYRALAEIHIGAKGIDRAFAAYSALALLVPDDAGARAFLDANRAKIEQGMLKAIDDTTRVERLIHPLARSPLSPGLFALGDAVGGAYPVPIDPTQLIAIDLKAPTPLARMIDSIRARLGLSNLLLYVRPAAVPATRNSLADLVAVGTVKLETGESPALVVDDTLAAAVPDRRGALFLLGKHVERLKSGYATYLRLPLETIDPLARILKRAFDPVPSPSAPIPNMTPEVLGAMIKALRKAAPRKYRKEIEELAQTITPEKLQQFVIGWRHTENRAGLLVCNDLVQAARVALSLDPVLARVDLDKVPDRVAHLKKSDEVTELLRFLSSEDYFALRKQLGLSL